MSSLGFSFISNNESKNTEQSKKKKHCRTLRKKHKKKTSKIDNLLNSLSATQNNREGLSNSNRSKLSVRENDDDDDDDEALADFNPPPPPTNNSLTRDSYGNMENDTEEEEDEQDNITQENFAQLGEVTADNYYKQYVPYYSQMQGSSAEVHTDKDALITKLNYMIHLLEEQQDEKTENVTEELVLYLFLGVFVIFIVDSFARAGKYTR